MRVKYFDVVEYFRDSNMKAQVRQTMDEFQEFAPLYHKMEGLMNLDV